MAADVIARARLVEIEQRIDALTVLKAELQRMIAECSRGRVAECRVIEVLADHNNKSVTGQAESATQVRPCPAPPAMEALDDGTVRPPPDRSFTAVLRENAATKSQRIGRNDREQNVAGTLATTRKINNLEDAHCVRDAGSQVPAAGLTNRAN